MKQETPAEKQKVKVVSVGIRHTITLTALHFVVLSRRHGGAGHSAAHRCPSRRVLATLLLLASPILVTVLALLHFRVMVGYA